MKGNVQTHFERVGGEAALRRIIDAFVARVTTDVMIGFFFAGVDTERLARLEFELAAEFLGAPIAYSGRPLEAAHRRHRIMGGQFARRKKILDEVLREHSIPADIHAAWIAHTEGLRPLITGQASGECQ
jgi:hemoglobin